LAEQTQLRRARSKRCDWYEPSPGTDMGGWPLSRCRCGTSRPSPIADVGGVGPVPVQMQERWAQSPYRCGTRRYVRRQLQLVATVCERIREEEGRASRNVHLALCRLRAMLQRRGASKVATRLLRLSRGVEQAGGWHVQTRPGNSNAADYRQQATTRSAREIAAQTTSCALRRASAAAGVHEWLGGTARAMARRRVSRGKGRW
jgi:hypothetical protein